MASPSSREPAVIFSLPSLPVCPCVSLKGLIVFIAEAAASLTGALEEYMQELHNKTSLSMHSRAYLLRGPCAHVKQGRWLL